MANEICFFRKTIKINNRSVYIINVKISIVLAYK